MCPCRSSHLADMLDSIKCRRHQALEFSDPCKLVFCMIYRQLSLIGFRAVAFLRRLATSPTVLRWQSSTPSPTSHRIGTPTKHERLSLPHPVTFGHDADAVTGFWRVVPVSQDTSGCKRMGSNQLLRLDQQLWPLSGTTSKFSQFNSWQE